MFAHTNARLRVRHTRQESFKNRLKSATHVRESSKHRELNGPITGCVESRPTDQ